MGSHTSTTLLLGRQPCTSGVKCPLTRVSRILHLQKYRSETHLLTQDTAHTFTRGWPSPHGNLRPSPTSPLPHRPSCPPYPGAVSRVFSSLIKPQSLTHYNQPGTPPPPPQPVLPIAGPYTRPLSLMKGVDVSEFPSFQKSQLTSRYSSAWNFRPRPLRLLPRSKRTCCCHGSDSTHAVF